MSNETPQTARRGGRIAGMASAGLLAAILAVGVSNVALAQPSENVVEPTAAPVTSVEPLVAHDEAELDATWQSFDACLVEQGLDIEALEDDIGFELSGDEAAIDAAFEACDSIIADLGVDLENIDEGDWEADEALWAEFDACLTEQGLDIEALEVAEENDELTEADEDELDMAFDACEPILGDMVDVYEMDEAEYEAAEAVFEEYDACLADAGIDIDALEAAEDGGELTASDEEALDAAFAGCDPILEELPEHFEFFEAFDDCDDEDEDDEDEDDDLGEEGAGS